jgi:hypothetical protein
VEVYVDRFGLDRWKNASLAHRLTLADLGQTLDTDFQPQVDNGNLSFKGVSNKQIETASQGVLHWRGPTGTMAKSIAYVGRDRKINAPLDYDVPTLHAWNNDGVGMGSWDQYPLVFDDTLRIQSLTVAPRIFLGFRLRAARALNISPSNAAQRLIRQIAVYGNHGAPLRDNGTEPRGVYASDVMRDVINRFCPMLNAGGVKDTQTVIDHLVFDTPTDPYDAFTLVNGYHQWLLAAWEDGTVEFQPADLSTPDWIVRTDDEGITVELHGDNVDQFANGIVVSYTSIDDRTVVLTPLAEPSLRDDDPDNPANKERIEHWTRLELSVRATRKMALALGQAALREFNTPKRPGTITVAGGYVPDSQRNPQPGWRVRYGQTIQIADLLNDERGRLITQTSWDGDGNLTITLEQPPPRTEAILARLEAGAEAID